MRDSIETMPLPSADDDPAHRVLGHYALYRFEDRSLHLGWHSGFFSNNTVALWSLCELLKDRLVVDRIHYLFGFSAYRNCDQPIYEYDLYPDYFTPDSAVTLPDPQLIRFVNHHGLYHELNHEWLNPLLNRYFSPSEGIRRIVDAWKVKYRFDGSRTIGVCYRGTDKGTEVKLADPRAYLNVTRNLLKKHPDYRVMIQTDQQQVRDLFLREFGDCCWFIEELPVTSGQASLAHISTRERGVDRHQFGLRILASALLLADCNQLVNHTGNMGLWIALFRGHREHAVQFGATGRLSTPFRRRWHHRRRALTRCVYDLLTSCSLANRPAKIPGYGQ
jgi:hypothetical protein